MSSNGKDTSFKVLIFSTSITVDRTEHHAQDVHICSYMHSKDT